MKKVTFSDDITIFTYNPKTLIKKLKKTKKVKNLKKFKFFSVCCCLLSVLIFSIFF